MENNQINSVEDNNQLDEAITEKKTHKKIVIISSIIVVSVIVWLGFTKMGLIPNFLDIEILCPKNRAPLASETSVDKPVIYLYPEKKLDIKVKLDYRGKIIADYPTYNNEIKGWSVTAYPDGKIINHSDNNEYSYIFWEGEAEKKIDWNLSKGFIVKGEDTKLFLQKTLSKIGLTPKEYNEFIVYWFPLMQNNRYNLIHFAEKQYTDTAPLIIEPKPDSILRVFMVFKALEKPIEIDEQEIKPFERKGFSVIEWGGTEIGEK